MDEIIKEQLVNELVQPVMYPDGTVYDNFTGEQIPRITPENFGVLHMEMQKLKAVLMGILEEE